MRVNVYAEELTENIEIHSKVIEGQEFTGLRIYLHLPVTLPDGTQAQGAFMHHPGDDDSSAVTFWGKRDLRSVLRKALVMLDSHYGGEPPQKGMDFEPPPPTTFQDRVRIERAELADRLAKLTAFRISDRWGSVDVAEQERLEDQEDLMASYLNVLDDRIAAFDQVPA